MNNQQLESLRHEYSESFNCFRHYSALRFAIFSVYFAVLGGIVTLACGFLEVKTPSQTNITRWAKLGGLLVTMVFSTLERLCELNIRHYKRVLKVLEGPLGYRPITTKQGHFLTAHRATSILFGVLILSWIIAILQDYGIL